MEMLTDRNLAALIARYNGKELSLEQFAEEVLQLVNGARKDDIEERVDEALDMLSKGVWPGAEAMELLEKEIQKGNLEVKAVNHGG